MMADVHRIGFTLLSTNEHAGNGPYQANIVFVHGLRGHPRYTWEDARAGSSDHNTATPNKRKTFQSLFRKSVSAADNTNEASTLQRLFWLEEFLTHDIPEARVWTYGYNADVIGVFQANNKNSVSQHGQDLAVKLEREIQNGDPIIFVAHSLGGIIVKDVLHRSDTCRSRTKAIVFLGTPHRGSTYSGWGTIASNLAQVALQDSNKKIVKTLEVSSEVLDNIHEEFKTIVSECGTRIHSFQEARGISGMKGLGSKVVDDFSSKLDLPRPLEIVESIDANHMEMARCRGRADPRYRAICGVLKQFMRDQVPCVNTKLQDMPSISIQVPRTSHDHNGPHKLLPFGRNGDFVGRESELNRLTTILHSEKSAEDGQRAALVGLGGVGKTQVALECAFRLQSISPAYSVFWVRASDRASFDNAYRDIGHELEIPGVEDDKADVKKLVKAKLSQSSTGNWLMIVDNADDLETFYNSDDDTGSVALSEYLPFSTLGAILFTTRDREAATRYAGTNVIDVEEMDGGESRDLLQRSLQNKELVKDDGGVTTLLKLLVNFPLAIMQAAAYLNAKSCTIAEYLRIYQGSSDNDIKLLSKDFEDIRRYPSIKNPIATTWLISFEQIRGRDRLAADYMAFISCIKAQEIPRNLLPPASELDKTEALGTLKAFGFIKERLVKGSYDMHPLVHMVMKNWLELKGEWRSWNETTLQQITNVFPWPQHKNRDVWMMYIPHAQCAIAIFQRSFGKAKDLPRRLLFNLAGSLVYQGKYAEAETIYRQTLQLQETVLGKDHPDTLQSMNNVASSLNRQGKYAEAKTIHQQTLQLREIVLGKDHPDTLRSMNNLANLLNRQGKYAEAETIHRQTLQLKETVLGKDHPDTLRSMNNLANSLHSQGKYTEAETIRRQTLQLKEIVLGKDHPDTLQSMNNVAHSLNSQGKYAEAMIVHRQTLQLREVVLGKDHPDTLQSMNNVAHSLNHQGKYAEAKTIYQQTLQLRETVLRKDHPDTLQSMNNVAHSLNSQGKHAEAMIIHRQTLQLREVVLGKDHPDTLQSMNNVASSLNSLGKYVEAEIIYRQTLQLREVVLGKDHPDTLQSMNNLANSLNHQGKYTEAKTIYQQTLQLREVVLGKDHPDTLQSMNNVAYSLYSQGKYAEAETIYRQTLQLQEIVLGKDHPDTLRTMNNLANSLNCQSKYAEAKTL